MGYRLLMLRSRIRGAAARVSVRVMGVTYGPQESPRVPFTGVNLPFGDLVLGDVANPAYAASVWSALAIGAAFASLVPCPAAPP